MADLLQQEEGTVSDPFCCHLRAMARSGSWCIYYTPALFQMLEERQWENQDKNPHLIELSLREIEFCFSKSLSAAACWLAGVVLGWRGTEVTSLDSLLCLDPCLEGVPTWAIAGQLCCEGSV